MMNNKLLKLIPKSIRVNLYYLYLFPLRKIRRYQSGGIPKNKLSNKHIEHARLLTDREELLKLLPVNGIVAELGVDEGRFSKKILAICKPERLHLIDYWGDKRYNLSKRKSVEAEFRNQIEKGEIKINIGLSTEVADQFPDEYFDWIYIDTDHTYETTIQELEAYRFKVKSDGIIAGHDFTIGNWNDIIKYGVMEAVYEFCVKYDWEILYLTSEIDDNPSFAIGKIKK